MKKHLISLFALILLAHTAWAGTVTEPSQIPSYWSSVNGKSGSDLWQAVSAETNKGFTSISYKGLYTAYLKTDVYPADSTDKAGKIWDMYGECDFSSGNTCGSYKNVCDCYNREHSIPQSWWGGGTGNIGSDIFHVLPTDGKVNGVRSNFEYGEVSGSGTNWVGNKFGSAGSWSTDRKTIATDAGESVSGSGNVFEPKPQYKGDLARGIMGTIVKWQQSNLTKDNSFFNGNYTVSGNFGLTKKAVVLLMKWHREDPVSRKEIDRNNGIQETQGNRNPFIDYPYLAEYIWGEHAGESVDMSQLIASCESGFVPGVSNGWRGQDTPVDPDPQDPQDPEEPEVPVVKYGVTWLSDGWPIQVDSVVEDGFVEELPETPVSCSVESTAFMGWTDAPIDGVTDDEPAVLFKKAEEIPAVTEDVSYYAVFAKEEQVEGAEAAVYTFDAEHQEGWNNTANKAGTYWLLDEGKELTSPAVDLSGLESVVVTIRTYGGKQYDRLAVVANGVTITTFEATQGSKMTEYTWTNTQSLSGTAPLVFRCSNAAANKGIGFNRMVINATGADISYSRYITSCQNTEEISTGTETVSSVVSIRKVLVDGQLYIICKGHMYNVQGKRVK